MNESTINLLIKHEGYKSRVYKDHLGFDTIGIGFLVKELDLTKEECMSILKRKLTELELRIHQTFEWYKDADDNTKCVVINMCYQLGLYGFSKFRKTIKLLEEKKLKEASIEMLDSKWAKEQTPNRAKELSKILIGDYSR